MLAHLNAPKLQFVGYAFLRNNQSITELSLPNLNHIGTYFMCRNNNLTRFAVPKQCPDWIGPGFLEANKTVSKAFLKRAFSQNKWSNKPIVLAESNNRV